MSGQRTSDAQPEEHGKLPSPLPEWLSIGRSVRCAYGKHPEPFEGTGRIVMHGECCVLVEPDDGTERRWFGPSTLTPSGTGEPRTETATNERRGTVMTKEQVDELLLAINSLVDNAGEWTSADIKDHASALQRMAANLPKLHRIAVAGWESSRQFAIAHRGHATERRADEMLRELGEEDS